MQKVIAVSLNGNAYQLDEAAYAQLAGYLNLEFAGNYYGTWAAAWNGIIGVAVVIALLWYALYHQAEVHGLFEQFMRWWQDVIGHHATLET
jgi:hypothetical protein